MDSFEIPDIPEFGNDDEVLDAAMANSDEGTFSLGGPKDVAQAAEKTSKHATKVSASVGDVILHLQTQEVQRAALAVTHPPGFRQVMEEPTFARTVQQILAIAERYRQGELPEPATLDQDLLMLASLQMDLGTKVGYAEGVMHQNETTYKLVRDRYLLRAKQYADGQKIHMTDALLRAAAGEAAEEMREYLGKYLALVHTFKGLYYSTKQLIEVMDSAAKRLDKERRLPQEG